MRRWPQVDVAKLFDKGINHEDLERTDCRASSFLSHSTLAPTQVRSGTLMFTDRDNDAFAYVVDSVLQRAVISADAKR